MTVTYRGATATFEVNVIPKEISSITVEPKTGMTVTVGDELDMSNVTVTAIYKDGSSEVITDGYTVSGYDAKTLGKQTVTVTYRGATATFEVNVLPSQGTFITGDINGDGVISIVDATILQKYLANLVTFDDEQIAVADTNGDGSVTIADATQIQKYLAGYFEKF